jgi:hypothetical protein
LTQFIKGTTLHILRDIKLLLIYNDLERERIKNVEFAVKHQQKLTAIQKFGAFKVKETVGNVFFNMVEIIYINDEAFNGRNFTKQIASAERSGRVDICGKK